MVNDAGQPVTCEQQVDVCLYNLFYNLTRSLNEPMTPPPSPAQLLRWLPSVSPYIMSHMHLGSFSLMHLEQHCAHRTDTPQTWRFWRSKLPHLSCHGSLTTYRTVSSWPTRHYARLTFITTLANTVSLRDPCHFCNTGGRVYYIH